MCALYYLGYGQCYVCGATATQMSEPRGSLHAFIPKPGTLGLGFHPLHVEMNSFRWACKAAFNQDFRDWRVSGMIQNKWDVKLLLLLVTNSSQRFPVNI